ncbi:MAG: hypothetical protein E7672_03640 [Ruminococcaceae bacterium]|nr:hypothetical protein [Oscillospiraceae bacterium]
MPLITAQTNIIFAKEKEIKLKSDLAVALAESFPGKTENWLMINFEYGCSMYFGGSDAPCMVVTIEIFGKQTTESYDKMTEKTCQLISSVCGIPSDRIYVKYAEVERWGWNGRNF